MKVLKRNIDFQTLIRRLSPFKSISDPALNDLEKRFIFRRYAAGSVIIDSKRPAEDLFLLRMGSVHVLLRDNEGGNILLHSLKTGDIFGKPLPSPKKGTSISVIAMEESSCLILTKNELLRHMARFPETSMIFLKVMANRLEEAYEIMACLTLGDVGSRFLRLMEIIGKRDGITIGNETVLPKKLTQNEMARMIGARRETISRLISKYVSSGEIKKRGRELILIKAQ